MSNLKNRFFLKCEERRIYPRQLFAEMSKENKVDSKIFLPLLATTVVLSCFNKTRQRITTEYRKRGTINLKCIGLIEKRFVRASDRLSVNMSDNVEHSCLNGPGMRLCPPFPLWLPLALTYHRCIPFIRKHVYLVPHPRHI